MVRGTCCLRAPISRGVYGCQFCGWLRLPLPAPQRHRMPSHCPTATHACGAPIIDAQGLPRVWGGRVQWAAGMNPVLWAAWA